MGSVHWALSSSIAPRIPVASIWVWASARASRIPVVRFSRSGAGEIQSASRVAVSRSSGESVHGSLRTFMPKPTMSWPEAGCSMMRPASLRGPQRMSFGQRRRAAVRPIDFKCSSSDAPTRSENPAQTSAGPVAGSEAESQSPPFPETKARPKRPRPRVCESARTAVQGGRSRQMSFVEVVSARWM